MNYIDRFIREETLLGEVMEELERLKPKFNNERLVICNQDHLFNNRFWTPFAETSDPIDFDKEVLVRSSLLCKNLGKFSNLKRLMITEISFVQLRRLEEIKRLETLEIGLLTADDSTSMFNVPLKLPALKYLFVCEYTGKLLPSVPFQTPRLKAISFGTEAINHIRFYQHSVTHIEFERGGRIDCPLEDIIYDAFPNLQHLECHTYMDATIRVSINEVIKRLPFLTELHCNFGRLQSVTQSLLTEPADRVRKAVGELSSAARFANNPILKVFVQGIPLAQYEAFDDELITAGYLEMLKALHEDDKPEPTFQGRGSFFHVELATLCAVEPKLTRCRKTLDKFNKRFPNVHRVDVDMTGSPANFNSDCVIEILESLRSVGVLSFSSTAFQPCFYQCVLPNMDCLVNSLVLLRIHEPTHRNLLAALDYNFLQHLKKLRGFETNLVHKAAILKVITQPAHHPVRFVFRFSANEVVIKKVASNLFEVTLTERTDIKGIPRESTVKMGKLTAAQLRLKLAQDPICERVLKHPFDSLEPAEIKKLPRQYMEDGLRKYRSSMQRLRYRIEIPQEFSLKRPYVFDDESSDEETDWTKRFRLEPTEESTSQPVEQMPAQQAQPAQPAQQAQPAQPAQQPDVVLLDESEEEYSSDEEARPKTANKTTPAVQPTRNGLHPAQPSPAKAPAAQQAAKAAIHPAVSKSTASVQTNEHVPTAPAAQAAPQTVPAARSAQPSTVQANGPAQAPTVQTTRYTQAPATVQANGPAQAPTVQATRSAQAPATAQATGFAQMPATAPTAAKATTKPMTAHLLAYPKSLHTTTLPSSNGPAQSGTVQFPPAPEPLRPTTNSYYASSTAPRTNNYAPSPTPSFYQPSASNAGYYVQNTLPTYYTQPVQGYPLFTSQPWQPNYQWASQYYPNPYYPTSSPYYQASNYGYPVTSTIYPPATSAYPTSTAAYPTSSAAYPTSSAAYPMSNAAYPASTSSYPASSYRNPSATFGYTPTHLNFSGINLQPHQPPAPAANPTVQPAPEANPAPATNPTVQSAPGANGPTA